MANSDKLKDYVLSQLQSGVNPVEIAEQLRGADWSEDEITQAFQAAQATITPGEPKSGIEKDDPSDYQAVGQMRGRIKTAWLLLKQSLKVLLGNKELLRYPAMGLLLSIIIAAVFCSIGFLGGDAFYYTEEVALGDTETRLTPLGMALGFVYYVVVFFAVFTYNAGLAAHVLDIFRGKSLDYKHYMKIAWSKKSTIFVYAIITATVGMILRIIEQRAAWLGWIVSRVLGVAWALANLFTIQVIVESDTSAPDAIKQSSKLFISRWGESIAARIGFGGIMFLFYLLVLVPLIFVTGFIITSLGVAGFFVWMGLILLLALIFSVIESAASQILSTALYYYAKYKEVPAAFDRDLLNASLITKKKL